MNWNDLEVIWRRQEPPVGAAADLAVLKQTFETKRRKMAGVLFARDVLEASAGVLVSGATAFIWWQQGKSGWPIAFSIALTMAVTAIFVRERVRTHRMRLGPDATLLAKLDAEIAELRHQRHLLLGIWKWYLAPIAAAIVITCVTIGMSRPPWDLARDPVFMGSYCVFVALLMWGVWVLNRQAVRKQVEPRLEELEKLHRDILSSK